MKRLAGIATVWFFAALCLPADPVHAAGSKGTVKVFLLAGQSNMEGKAKNSLLDYQAEAPRTREFFRHLRRDGKWVVRDDVFIKFLKRHGPLTIGYGSPGRTGVELEFGTVMGEHFAEPVLLIKAAWGGHALFRQFRPPSAGLPPEDYLRAELEKARQRVRKANEKKKRSDPLPTMEDIKAPYGQSYRNMLAEVKDVFENYATLFPALKGRKLEMAGFVWFHGWNDMFGELAPAEYASNLKHLIGDLRRDLNCPNLPVVIAAMGQNGSKPASKGMAAVKKAQFAMNDVPEFRGNVRTIATDVLVDKDAEALYPKWKQNFEQWQKTGSDFGYHYMGSAIWFTRIGRSMAETMLELMGERPGRGAAAPAR